MIPTMKSFCSMLTLAFTLLFSNCNKKRTFTLQGEIGNGFHSILTLELNGDNASGQLVYLHDNTSLDVNGSIKNSVLTLYEYNASKKISGVFVGTFDNYSYDGSWSHPKGKSNALFKFQVLDHNKTKEPATSADSNQKEKDRIKQTYAEWVQKQVRSGKYWTEKQWNKAFEPYQGDSEGDFEQFLERCLDALPEKMDEVHYGDINGDNILDAWAYIVPIYCMPGTWQNGIRHLPMFFMSNPNNSYSVILEPEKIGAEVGTFGTVDTIVNGVIMYEGRDYGDDDARCCPSKTWKVKFRYKDGNFKKI